jgi:CheY-like chemotaxis protein
LVKPLKRETLMRLTARAAGIAFDRPDDGPGVPSERSPGPQSQLPVLLVEDNVVNQKVASRMLDRLGYAHEVASDGRAATEAVAAKRYGAVLMDCQMPGMDGFEATEAIRDMERGKRHTPIVAMTAMAMKGDEANCLAAGMDGYLAKPIKLKALRDVLGYYMRLNENSLPPHGPEQEAPAS